MSAHFFCSIAVAGTPVLACFVNVAVNLLLRGASLFPFDFLIGKCAGCLCMFPFRLEKSTFSCEKEGSIILKAERRFGADVRRKGVWWHERYATIIVK